MDFDIVRFMSFISLPLMIPVILYALRKFFKKPVTQNPTPVIVSIFLVITALTLIAQVTVEFKVAALLIEGLVYVVFWHLAYSEYKQNTQA